MAQNEYLVDGADMTTVADAIREKGGTTAPLSFPDGMASAVRDISASGGIKVLSPDLHDTATDTANTYIENGQEKEYKGWSATDYIPIEEDSVYAVFADKLYIDATYCALYDAGKAFLKKIAQDGGFYSAQKVSFVTYKPDVTGYIRFSGRDEAIHNMHYYKCSGNIDDSDIVNDVNI